MRAKALIDTGAILALLDRDDRWHHPCVDIFSSFRLPLFTSAAVLTELFHLIGDSHHEMSAAWSLLNADVVSMLSIDDGDKNALETLMKKYHDRPMDFADATLVYLARRESLTSIFTINHNDFETYRIEGRRKFRILPAR